MKYIIFYLIIPSVAILLLPVFLVGAIFFGVDNLMKWSRQFTPAYAAAKQRSRLHDARSFRRS